jgi:hypothetical protein
MNTISSSHGNSTGIVLDTHMSMEAAAAYSGYNIQYLRRIVRDGLIEGVKVGPIWLVKTASMDAYLKSVRQTDDRRYGPRVYQEYMNEQGG